MRTLDFGALASFLGCTHLNSSICTVYILYVHSYVQALAPVVWWEDWVVYYAIGVRCQAVTGGDFSNSVTQLRMLVAAGLCPVKKIACGVEITCAISRTP